MSVYIYPSGGAGPVPYLGAVKLTCPDHPRYEGTRQSRAFLDWCHGCRAVYHVCKAMQAAKLAAEVLSR